MAIIEPIPAFSDNYVWLMTAPSSDGAVVVDPGEAELVLENLEKRELRLEAILLTHHHGDHVGGVSDVLGSHSSPVYGPARETISTVDRPVGGGDRALLPETGLELEVIDVPGHTAGHIAYLGNGFAFVGDTLFAGGCGRIFEGTPVQMYNSLNRLAGLPGETLVYCAHEYTVANLQFAREVEPDNRALEARAERARTTRAAGSPTVPSTIAEELETNPFLRCQQPAVISAARQFAGRDLTSEVEVFATIRAWKDGWRG